MAAEAITALKGFDGHDDGDPWKNVRYGYIEFDRDGATVVTSLLKEEINKAPVSDEEMLDEFEMVQTRECGEGTDSETDLCEALQAAFDEFDAAGNVEADSFTPEREKKILIVSHNMDDGVCADGQSMCDKFAEEIRGGGENDHGVSVFMINIDVEAGTQGTYELCLVMGEEDRIDDIGTDSHLLYSKEGLNGGPSPNSLRDGVISMLQYELCQTVPTSNPTTDPTTNPTTPSPTTPSPTTPSPTTPSPTTPSPTTPSPTTPSPTTPSPTTPSPTTPSPTTPSPTTPSPTTPSPTTPSPTTPSPTTPSPTTPSPTTPSPTTPSPTTTTTAKPSPAPTYQICGEFGLSATRRADYLVLSDMSEEDGSYNDACDYYQRDEDSVTSIPPGNKLSGQGSLNPGQLRIGETMSIELDLLVNSECTQELGCDVIQIGSASDDYYPLVQLADGGMIQIKTKEYASDGTVEEKTYQSDTAIVTVGDYTRLSVVWTMNSLVVTYGDTVVINDVTNVRDHPADTTNYWDAPDKDTNGTFMHKMYAANEGADIAHANFKNLCIKTSWTPSYWKVMPTYCQAKQNMAAEAITALKGFDGHDDGDPWKNVRYGYIEFDRDGATVVTSLLKEEINKAPVSDEEMLDEFEMVQTRECGEGTDSETDLCEALQAAFDEFDAAGNVEADSFTPEREKKILIVSHNMDDGVCADGQSMCDKFAEEIRGGGENDHGVSVFMINIDVEAGTQGTYELCLVMGEEDRIDDIGTDSHLLYSKEGLNGGPSPNSLRDGVISMLQYELCQTVPTSNPTTDPTTNPTTPSPTIQLRQVLRLQVLRHQVLPLHLQRLLVLRLRLLPHLVQL
eukprot:780988_1